ncbi:CatB-related O-acetyltransferase [Defluviimonas sp. WL0075]|uniref:CatB-related O-acetyltransferase n=1 Tax=Albidovulum sediminicola TaxID=2984331 RepID=UPI002980F195|nr:CatB-related O-acetyltransferase [Defluviimonas sp. WL0075]
MRLSDKLDAFLAGRTIEGTRSISRGGAKRLGHTTSANPKLYSFEARSQLNGTWHVDGPHVPRLGFIGAYSYVNSFSYVRNETFIGRYTSVGCRVSIGALRHPISSLSTSNHLLCDARPYTEKEAESVRFYRNTRRNVVIGSDVWIGDGAVIMPGITIADGAVIGANSVVTRDVGAHEIVAGVPAKTIGRRFSEPLSERLIEAKWWEYQNDLLRTLPTGNVFAFLEAVEGAPLPLAELATFKIRKFTSALKALFPRT